MAANLGRLSTVSSALAVLVLTCQASAATRGDELLEQFTNVLQPENFRNIHATFSYSFSDTRRRGAAVKHTFDYKQKGNRYIYHQQSEQHDGVWNHAVSWNDSVFVDFGEQEGWVGSPESTLIVIVDDRSRTNSAFEALGKLVGFVAPGETLHLVDYDSVQNVMSLVSNARPRARVYFIRGREPQYSRIEYLDAAQRVHTVEEVEEWVVIDGLPIPAKKTVYHADSDDKIVYELDAVELGDIEFDTDFIVPIPYRDDLHLYDGRFTSYTLVSSIKREDIESKRYLEVLDEVNANPFSEDYASIVSEVLEDLLENLDAETQTAAKPSNPKVDDRLLNEDAADLEHQASGNLKHRSSRLAIFIALLVVSGTCVQLTHRFITKRNSANSSGGQ